MKKYIFLISILFIVSLSFGQGYNKVVSITPDTLTKVETEYFSVQNVTGTVSTISIGVLFTEISGTSDGSAVLQGSVDGVSYYTLSSETGKMAFYPNDTLTITDGAIWVIELTNPAFVSYRIAATGTASDVTLITPNYIIKK